MAVQSLALQHHALRELIKPSQFTRLANILTDNLVTHIRTSDHAMLQWAVSDKDHPVPVMHQQRHSRFCSCLCLHQMLPFSACQAVSYTASALIIPGVTNAMIRRSGPLLATKRIMHKLTCMQVHSSCMIHADSRAWWRHVWSIISDAANPRRVHMHIMMYSDLLHDPCTKQSAVMACLVHHWPQDVLNTSSQAYTYT